MTIDSPLSCHFWRVAWPQFVRPRERCRRHYGNGIATRSACPELVEGQIAASVVERLVAQ
jgi:hypothetical protein